MSIIIVPILLGALCLIGVVVVGVVAFARSTSRSEVGRSSVDDPGLDHRKH